MKQLVQNNKKAQEKRDARDIRETLDRNRHALAIGDIVSCTRVAIINGSESTRRRNLPQKERLDEIDPKVMISSSDIADRLEAIKRIEDSLSCGAPSKMKVSSKDKNSELVHAMDYASRAKSLLDPSRFNFEAAKLFDNIGMIDRSIECFRKCTTFFDSANIVDTYDLPITPMVQRKIDHMSPFQIESFMKERHDRRFYFIHNEEERQRLRAILSHCHLARLYIITKEAELAHCSINASLKLCSSPAERTEIMQYYHNLLKLNANKTIGDYREPLQVFYERKGILPEIHLQILLELEKEDPRNTDYLEWIATRYAERCDFSTSQAYFKKMRDLLEPELSDQELLQNFLLRQVGLNDEELYQAVSKRKHMNYSFDVETDKQAAAARTDYIGFHRKHIGTDVQLFTAPAQGWQRGADGYARRLELLGQTLRLPDPKDKPP